MAELHYQGKTGTTMMNREDWLLIRKQEHIPVEVFHEYYLDKGGLLTDKKDFTSIFFQLVAQHAICSTPRGPKRITYETAIQKTFEHFDNKFAV